MASEFIAYIDEAGDEGFGKIKTQAQPDALEQALHARRPVHRSGLIHHSD